MITKKYDAVATIGKYKSRDGEEKKRYLTVGAVFEDENGRLGLKLDALPVSQEWSGWITFYPLQDKNPTSPQSRNYPTPKKSDNEITW